MVGIGAGPGPGPDAGHALFLDVHAGARGKGRDRVAVVSSPPQITAWHPGLVNPIVSDIAVPLKHTEQGSQAHMARTPQ
jgi:hypothetical protein